MKRLFLTFGLVIAFLFTAQLSATTIFDNASYQTPKFQNDFTYKCYLNGYVYADNIVHSSSLLTEFSKCVPSATEAAKKQNFCVAFDFTFVAPSTLKYKIPKIYTNGQGQSACDSSNSINTTASLAADKIAQSISSECPPDSFPNYIFGRDTNNDGKTDQCYNPDELDNASNCANQIGSMLPALTNLATRVCKTDPDTGASCGYSKKDGDPSYQLDLEMSCFGDGEKVPEYDPEPMPQPETCAKVNDQLMVCKEKPENKCDAMGNCQDQCGYVNKEFYCFIPCTGEDCDKPTPPVNCETNPDAPVCVEEPDPEFCAANPTDPKCTGTTPPDEGGENGGGVSVDLSPVVNELKALNNKLDFSTLKNESTRKMGLLETAFDEDAISELKSKTDEIKTEINGFYTSTKAEISSMFSFSTGGGSYEPITFAFTYGTYSSKIWEYFSQNVAYIAAAIMFLAYLMAARIVLE